jgi:hypothetical protein
MLSKEELDALAADIKANGLLFPIMIYQGKILDGRNRYQAARSVGHEFKEYDFRELSEYRNPKAYVITANIRRRHLTTKRKQELITELLKIDATQSNRAIASVTGVDHKTVGAVREAGEATGEIPQLTETNGKDGKTRKVKAKGEGKKGKGKNQIVINEEVQPTHANFLSRLELMLEALEEWPKGNLPLAKEWADEARGRIDEVIEQLEFEAEGEAEGEQQARKRAALATESPSSFGRQRSRSRLLINESQSVLPVKPLTHQIFLV